MKTTPKEISPNPLVSSVVEIRFLSELKTEELLGKFFPIIGEGFPNITYSDLPRPIRKTNEKFLYNPDFIFNNNDYSVSIGTNILSFENVGTYHLWSNYYSLIKDFISKVNNLNIIKKIERVGVRYISLFDSKYKIKEITKIKFNLDYDDFDQNNNFLQTELLKGEIRLVVRIAENGNVNKGQQTFKGLFVDIDASQSLDLPELFNQNLLNIIDKLHSEEKLLFYNLLQEDFLKSLNPKY